MYAATACPTCASLRAAAVRLVGDTGFEGLSPSGLCEECGLTRTELADHYQSAEACLYDAYREISGEMLLEVSVAFDSSNTWNEALNNASSRMLARLAERPHEAQLLFVEALRGDRELRRCRESARQQMVALFVAEHRRRSELEEIPQVQVEMLLGARFHLIATHVAEGRISELPELSADLAQVVDVFEPMAAAA
jgi:AcrR family transcriptional regulator